MATISSQPLLFVRLITLSGCLLSAVLTRNELFNVVLDYQPCLKA